jgi:2-(3-amino-3-carboxypropyl)histidine synthase
VALQFPEGLLIYSTLIADLISAYCSGPYDEVDTVIMGDVTYGACCIDDLGARALGANFMVHYAHSCLVPIQEMVLSDVLYVFVTIGINLEHFVNTLSLHLSDHKQSDLFLLGTIQFTGSLFMCRKLLGEQGFEHIQIPQTKPRSGGEVLGCTAPKIKGTEGRDIVAVFLADGRFHIESTMIQNPHIEYFYQYDPYSRKFTKEKYDVDKMHEIRESEIQKAKNARCLGIILGTLGRQGNSGLLENFRKI